MGRYRPKSCPSTELELPEKSLEFAVHEFDGIKRCMHYLIFPSLVDVQDGLDTAESLLGKYIAKRAKRALSTKFIDYSAIRKDERDPFIFMSKYSQLLMYKRLSELEGRDIKEVFFTDAINYFEDAINITLALAYLQKEKKDTKALQSFYRKNIFGRIKGYDFFLKSLCDLLEDEEETIH